MLRLTSDWILHPNGRLVQGHTLLVEPNGEVVDLIEHVDNQTDHLKGILCPGFVNAHTHIELSHLSGKIKPSKSLAGFIRQFVPARREFSQGISSAADVACKSMWDLGIQGAGDICNTRDASAVKKNSPIRFYSFSEAFAPMTEKSVEQFHLVREIAESIRSDGDSAATVPHAPYSVPEQLFLLLKDNAEQNNSLWSMHNQESAAENELFINGSGQLLELFQEMGFSMEWFQPSGISSLRSVAKYFPASGNILLVHNTYTTAQDIQFLVDAKLLDRCWFCLCPRANLFIEERLPDVLTLMRKGCRIVVGTDSLASNFSLSVLEELKTLKQHFPQISIAELLCWATAEGADFFGWNDLGRFVAGAKPGVLLINGSDSNKFLPEASIQRII